MSWEVKQLLRERLAEEKGYYLYPLGVRSRFALVYPNSYFVGMSNLGFHIIYDLLNRMNVKAGYIGTLGYIYEDKMNEIKKCKKKREKWIGKVLQKT